MTKYSVPEDAFESDDEPEDESPASIQSIRVDVILVTDPTDDMGYGREKYTAHVKTDDDGTRVVFFTEHTWKGNYWREFKDWDWQDVPGSVRQKVADAMNVEDWRELDPGVRVVDEGGEKRFEFRGGDDGQA